MRVATLVLGILLAATPALADWRASGSLEPDTDHDRRDGFMFTFANAEPVARVYFNGYLAVEGTSSSPNVALLGTSVLPAPVARPRAMLGVWIDCNGDGYVGHAESALQEYRAELLPPNHPCPARTETGQPNHNDGVWVSEMLMIGKVDPCEFEPDEVRTAQCVGVDKFARNERVYYDNDTYVWGDRGKPGAPPRIECALAPLPKGATTSTGGALFFVDCQAGHRVAMTVNTVDGSGALGLRFADPRRPQDSTSHLNQPLPVTPWGTADAPGLLQRDAPTRAATVWDCSDPRAHEVRDPTGAAPTELVLEDPSGDRISGERFPFVIWYSITGLWLHDHDGDPSTPSRYTVPLTDREGAYARAPLLAPAAHDPRGSYWDAAEHAADGLDDCDDRTALHERHPGELVEGGATQGARKDRASFTFTFFDGHRGIDSRLDPTTGATTPSDGGLLAPRHGRGGAGPMWSALETLQADPQIIQRGDLDPAPGFHLSWYADVGEVRVTHGLATPPAGRAIYAAEACASDVGWECDHTKWWRDAQDGDATPRYAQGERLGRFPGDPYLLRDVDCHDGALARGTGLYASLAQLSAEGDCSGEHL